MMLTQYDINMMEDTVMDILNSWNTKVKILIPKPEEHQTNWNPIMREYTGGVDYISVDNVPAERLEVVNEYHTDRNVMKAGTKVESSILYKFPVIFDGKPLIITPDMIIVVDDGINKNKYHINTIRNRIGETIVDVDLIVGSDIVINNESQTNLDAILDDMLLNVSSALI